MSKAPKVKTVDGVKVLDEPARPTPRELAEQVEQAPEAEPAPKRAEPRRLTGNLKEGSKHDGQD